jgi:hypothetical protein
MNKYCPSCGTSDPSKFTRGTNKCVSCRKPRKTLTTVVNRPESLLNSYSWYRPTIIPEVIKNVLHYL